MKKLTAFLVAMALALSLAGCGSKKEDPKEIYDAASQKSASLTSLDADYEMSMAMEVGGESVDITSSMNMKMDGINSDQMRYLAEGTTSAMGQTIDTFMYYENGYCYMETMGQKLKYAMDLDAMVKQVQSSMDGAVMDSSYLTDIQAKEDGDNQILTYTGDASKMDTYVQEVMGSLGSSMGGQLDNVTYSIKAISGETVVNKDRYVLSSKVKMTMEMTMEGETANVEMDIEMIYHNPGQDVEVTAPSLDGYTEIDASQLGL